MKLTKYNKIRSILSAVLVLGMLFTSFSATASYQDSVINEVEVDTLATAEQGVEVDTVAVAEDDLSADTTQGEVLVSESTGATTGGTTTAAAEEEATDYSQAYMNLFYYSMLFLLICIVVAIIGKIHHIYSLTRRINGKYNPLGNNNLQAVLLLVFLAFFLWGTYYSYTVWGAWSWRDAVTEHGKDIDRMFIITLVITTFVMILVHILLLGFSYLYRMRLNRKAYFYPHNDAIERIWTIVPAIVLTILVLFGFFT